MREGWDVPAELRAALVKNQVTIALDKRNSARDRTAAFKALVAAAGGGNLSDEKPVASVTVNNLQVSAGNVDEYRARLLAQLDNGSEDTGGPARG